MCQDCIDNGMVSQAVYDSIEAFCERWAGKPYLFPGPGYGPAHIVLDDLNLGDENIKWCLGLLYGALTRDPSKLYKPDDVEFMERLNWYDDPAWDEYQRECKREEWQATVVFLEQLLAIPEIER